MAASNNQLKIYFTQGTKRKKCRKRKCQYGTIPSSLQWCTKFDPISVICTFHTPTSSQPTSEVTKSTGTNHTNSLIFAVFLFFFIVNPSNHRITLLAVLYNFTLCFAFICHISDNSLHAGLLI